MIGSPKFRISFKYLIEYLEQNKNDKNPVTRRLVEHALEQIKNAPELCGNDLTLETLEAHREQVEGLMAVVFSPVDLQTKPVFASRPFAMEPFFGSERWGEVRQLFIKNNERAGSFRKKDAKFFALLNSVILEKVFAQPSVIKGNMIFEAPDTRTGLNRYYKIDLNTQFVRIFPPASLREFGKENLNKLVLSVDKPEVWEEHMDYSDLVIEGFVVAELVDVTESELISRIRLELLSSEAIYSRDILHKLEQHLRELFRLPDMKLGLITLFESIQRGSGIDLSQSILRDNPELHNSLHDNQAGLIMEAKSSKGVVVAEDLTSCKFKSEMEQFILDRGFRSMMIAPLIHDGKPMGALEMVSTNPNDFTSMSALALQPLLPLFSMAMKQSLDQVKDRIDTVIKEDYTAIHPSVEWKFEQAALAKIRHRESGEIGESEPILFKEVYPFYGMSDVRGSSTIRNRAIEEDLVKQLTLANDALSNLYQKQALHLIESLQYRIHDKLELLKSSLASGEETETINFLQREVEPLLEQFRESGLLDQESYDSYFSALDPEVNILYHQRKRFEESVAILNDTLAMYIDKEQEKAQRFFPHYFERYKTDGVEYSMYIGQSMVRDQMFSPIYLKELQLWQLRMTCGLVMLAEKAKAEMPIPLETAHLLVDTINPITVVFREDEKRFDVDGAYNIRYEIIKKRVDKAVIKGTGERLTQPGNIAIVLPQMGRVDEILQHISFLQQKGILESEVESHDLEDLQGVIGLKALRVSVRQGEESLALIEDNQETGHTHQASEVHEA